MHKIRITIHSSSSLAIIKIHFIDFFLQLFSVNKHLFPSFYCVWFKKIRPLNINDADSPMDFFFSFYVVPFNYVANKVDDNQTLTKIHS